MALIHEGIRRGGGSTIELHPRGGVTRLCATTGARCHREAIMPWAGQSNNNASGVILYSVQWVVVMLHAPLRAS